LLEIVGGLNHLGTILKVSAEDVYVVAEIGIEDPLGYL
jgi:hypothetical protein